MEMLARNLLQFFFVVLFKGNTRVELHQIDLELYREINWKLRCYFWGLVVNDVNMNEDF